MKRVKILDVDFIGDQEALTKEEENALHEYFNKKSSSKKAIRKETSRKLKEKVG